MASVFGTPVTDYTQYAKGQFGYIIKVNLTAHLFSEIDKVQAQVPEFNTPAPVSGEVDIQTLYSYMNDIDCPDLAFNWNNGICSIFFKADGSDVSAWQANNRYAAGDYIIGAIAGNDAIFKCTTGGLSSAVEPTWLEDNTITDNDCSWDFKKYSGIPNTFNYTSTTRFAVFGKRKAQKAVNDGDALDLPDKDIRLMINYALRKVWNIKEKTIPKDIIDIIDEEEKRVRDE